MKPITKVKFDFSMGLVNTSSSQRLALNPNGFINLAL